MYWSRVQSSEINSIILQVKIVVFHAPHSLQMWYGTLEGQCDFRIIPLPMYTLNMLYLPWPTTCACILRCSWMITLVFSYFVTYVFVLSDKVIKFQTYFDLVIAEDVKQYKHLIFPPNKPWKANILWSLKWNFDIFHSAECLFTPGGLLLINPILWHKNCVTAAGCCSQKIQNSANKIVSASIYASQLSRNSREQKILQQQQVDRSFTTKSRQLHR